MFWFMVILMLITQVLSEKDTVDIDNCPKECSCPKNLEGYEYRCELPSGNLTVHFQPNDYMTIICDEGATRPYQCPELPRLPRLWNDTFHVVAIKNCPLPPEPLICGIRKLGANTTNKLILAEIPGGAANSLLAKHLNGLPELQELELRILFPSFSETSTTLSDLLSVTQNIKYLKLLSVPVVLKPNTTYRSASLQALDLYTCNITEIPDHAFSGLFSLRRLTIWNSRLNKVTRSTFEGLHSLQELSLSVTKLRALSEDMFLAIPELQSLRLVKNYLKELSLGSLQHLKSIVVDNNLTPLNLPVNALAGAPGLIELNATRSHLQTLRLGLFDKQDQLQRLDLSQNEIITLPQGLFLHLKNLKYLNLSKNLIKELPANVFFGLTKVAGIDLSDNQLIKINPSAFHDARALTWLSLARNELTLEPPALTGISHWELQSPLAFLIALRHLDLSGNHINTLFSDWLTVLLQLESLDLSHNNFTWLYGYSGFLQQNIQINLQYNKITKIDPPHSLQTADGTHITMLLEYNPLRCDCGLFELIDMLHETSGALLIDFRGAVCESPLRLSGQSLKDVQPVDVTCFCPHLPNTCRGCHARPAVKILELDCYAQPTLQEYEYLLKNTEYNMSLRLRNETDSLLTLPPKVRHLSLTRLNLTELPALPLVHLDSLDISDNLLSTVPINLFKHDIKLFLRRNPIKCDCVHAADVSALKRHKQNIIDYQSITCRDQEKVDSVDVTRLCTLTHAMVTGGALAALGLLVVVAAGALYWYGVPLLVLLDTYGLLPRWFTKLDIDDDKIYDAFVSFAHEDHFFVQDEILPGLADYNLCLHYRDWVGGGWIPSQISNSVKNSRRTILVVSKSFVKSRWSIMEFRTAQEFSIAERRQRLIVILVDDVIDDKSIDKDLRQHLKLHTYIKWGDNWFWEKIHFALRRGAVRHPIRDWKDKKLRMKNKNLDDFEIWLKPDGTISDGQAHRDGSDF